MRQFLLQTLNQHFRPPSPVSVSLFPDDEFDETEALQLKEFCDMLYAKGYVDLFESKNSGKFEDIIDLAASYGTFVSVEAAPWYLGVFIAAECLMKPLGHDSYFESMLRSFVFMTAKEPWKKLSLWLMLMAIFCDRPETSGRRVKLFINECLVQGYSLNELPIQSFCKVRRIFKRLKI